MKKLLKYAAIFVAAAAAGLAFFYFNYCGGAAHGLC